MVVAGPEPYTKKAVLCVVQDKFMEMELAVHLRKKMVCTDLFSVLIC